MVAYLLLSSWGFAQDGGFDAHGFRLASADADLRDPLTFVRPGDQRTLDTSFGLVGEYAARPLRFEPRPGEPEVFLRDLVAVNVAAGFVPWSPIRIGLELPVFLSSASPAAGVDAQPTALGDLRATGMVVLAQPRGTKGIGVGLVGHVSAPTGDPALWLGEGDVAGGGAVVGTIESPRVSTSWRLGARFTPNNPPGASGVRTRGGDVLEGAFSLNLLTSDSFSLGAETHVAFAIDPVVRQAIGVPAEAMLTGRYVHRDSGVFLMAGVGTALGQGAGASPIRAVFGGGFGLGTGGSSDRDGDGLADIDDACPEEPELLNGYRDEDGCPDALPRLLVVADVEEGSGEAAIRVVLGNGTEERGVGEVALNARPGQLIVADARVAGCRRGKLEVRVEDLPEQTVSIPVERVSARARITVRDVAGRFLKTASVRYVVDDPVCGPVDGSLVQGTGIHDIGAGPATVLVTAPGYDIHQQTIDLDANEEVEVKAQLAPTQVQLRDDSVVFATPLLFKRGTSDLEAGAEALVSQLATIVLKEGRKARVTGHPDAGGGGGRQLSWARANALRAALVQEGVDQSMIVTTGGRAPLAAGHITVRML